MRLPRDLSGAELARRLSRLGYSITRQTGSHLRLTVRTPEGDRHVTVPDHAALRVGTLAAILADVAEQRGLSRHDIAGQILR